MSPSPRGPAPWLVAFACLVTAFAAAPVLLSHDVYSYVDYARLAVVHGLDPYVDPPAAAPADPIYPQVQWTDATSAYGPLFTLLTYPLAWLPVGAAVATLKAAAALSVLAIAALVHRLAPARGVAPLPAAAFVALNPLLLIHVVGGAHNDGLAMLLAMLGVAALLATRELAAGATLATAAAVKASTAVIAPFALLATLPRGLGGASRGRARSAVQGAPPAGRIPTTLVDFRPTGGLLLGGALAAAAIGVAAYAAFGWSWLGALGLAGENQDRTSFMSAPITFARLTGLDPGTVRAAALALFAATLAYLLLRTWQGADWLRMAAWATLALLLATAWLLPWYLIWLVPLAALSRDRPLQLLTIALTAYQLPARMPL